MRLKVETEAEQKKRLQALLRDNWRPTEGSRSKTYPNANSCGTSPKRFARHGEKG